MRWLPLALLAYVMLGLQLGLGGLLKFHGGEMDLVLIAAVFIALNARRQMAVPVCFGLGLLHDFIGIGPLGTYALAYSLVAVLIAGTDRALAPEHPFTHFFVTLIAGVMVAFVVVIQGRFARYGVPVALWPSMIGAFYTAVIALPALWLLGRFRRAFRFRMGG